MGGGGREKIPQIRYRRAGDVSNFATAPGRTKNFRCTWSLGILRFFFKMIFLWYMEQDLNRLAFSRIMKIGGSTMPILLSVILSLLGAFVCAPGHSASAYKRTLTVKKGQYLKDGVFTGGQAGSGSTLLAIRRTYSPKVKIERVVLDVGDKDGKTARPKEMGYFQAGVDAKKNRITVDLAQMKMSMVTEMQLQQIFKKSPYVKSAEFTLDPEDTAGTLVLNLKQPARLEAFRLVKPGKPARVVLDIVPVAQARAQTRSKSR